MELFVVRSARWRYWLLLAVSLGFVAIGILALTSGSRWMGGSLILFFGAAAVVFLRELSDSRPRIRIDESGVDDRTLGLGTIPWSEITSAYRKDLQGSPFVCLVLRDAQPWVQKLSAAQRTMITANRALGCMEFNLNLAGVDVEAEQVYQLVLKLSAAARPPDD